MSRSKPNEGQGGLGGQENPLLGPGMGSSNGKVAAGDCDPSDFEHLKEMVSFFWKLAV